MALPRLEPIDPELTKEEVLERAIWSLQADFQDLCKTDSDAASKFLEWAVREWERAIKVNTSEGSN